MFENSNIQYRVVKDYNISCAENQNSFISVRKVQWVKEGDQPDESKAKIEIRKIAVNAKGETPLKGIAFPDEKSVGELTVGLIESGFGETKAIVKAVSHRDDIKEAINTLNDDPDDGDEGEYFDMRTLLTNLDSETNE